MAMQFINYWCTVSQSYVCDGHFYENSDGQGFVFSFGGADSHGKHVQSYDKSTGTWYEIIIIETFLDKI